MTQLTIVAEQRTDAAQTSGSRRMLTVTVVTSIAPAFLAAVALLPDRSNGVSSQNSTAVIPNNGIHDAGELLMFSLSLTR